VRVGARRCVFVINKSDKCIFKRSDDDDVLKKCARYPSAAALYKHAHRGSGIKRWNARLLLLIIIARLKKSKKNRETYSSKSLLARARLNTYI